MSDGYEEKLRRVQLISQNNRERAKNHFRGKTIIHWDGGMPMEEEECKKTLVRPPKK